MDGTDEAEYHVLLGRLYGAVSEYFYPRYCDDDDITCLQLSDLVWLLASHPHLARSINDVRRFTDRRVSIHESRA